MSFDPLFEGLRPGKTYPNAALEIALNRHLRNALGPPFPGHAKHFAFNA